MIQFRDIEQTLLSRGVSFALNEYLFTELIALGEEKHIAYALCFEPSEYKSIKDSENEKEYFPKYTKCADDLLQKQHIIQLKNELEYRKKKEIQDAALNLDDIELTSNDVKKVLALFLRDRIDDPSSASVKELVDLLKMYQPYLPDDASAMDFQRHFIQVHEPYNAICNNCNREISAYKGLSCVCEHCGQKYIWDNEQERFFPQVDNL